MKILIFLSFTIALSSAGYAGNYYQPQVYQPQVHQPIHIPVIGPNGVPVETPEVQAAKAHHYAEYAKVLSRPGQNIPDTSDYSHGGEGHYSAPAQYVAPAEHAAYSHAPAYYPGPGAQIGHDGRPIETHEVQAAKAAHFAALAEASSRAGYGHGHGHYRRRRGIFGGYHADYHVPVIDHNGVPVETPEVQAAKAHHFAEYAKVLSRPGQNIPDYSEYSHESSGQYAPAIQHYSAPAVSNVHYSVPAYSHATYHGPYAEIGHDGQPIETYEVQAAKAAHLAAHQAAQAQKYGHHYY